MSTTADIFVPRPTDNLGAYFSGRWQGNVRGGAWFTGKANAGDSDLFTRKPDEWYAPFDYTRMALYRQHALLFHGDYYDAFRSVRRRLSSVSRGDFFDEATWDTLYIGVNVLGLCSRKHADLLAVEPPEIKPDHRDNAPMADAIRRIMKNSRFSSWLYDFVLPIGYKGDGVLKVEYLADERDADNPRGKVRIGKIRPDCWFPEFDTDDMDRIKSHTVAYKIAAPGYRDKPLIKRIIHYPDRIERHLNVLDGNTICDEIVPETVGLEPWDDVSYHDLGEPLIVHVPNFRADELPFGLSDYFDVKPIADELCHRLTQYSNVLDKHGNPKMVGPDLIGPDGTVHVEDYFAYSPDESKPEYLALPADALTHMASAMKDFIPVILFLMEISPGLVGWQEGAGVERVEALRLKNINAVMKSYRKQRYLTDALKTAFRLAMQLENKYAGFSYEFGDVGVDWQDGLPESSRERAETMSIRLQGKPSISQEGAVRELTDDPDIEIERMKAEGVLGDIAGGEHDLNIKPLSQIVAEKQAAEQAAQATAENKLLDEIPDEGGQGVKPIA